MYKKILVALENGPADQALLPHIGQLAQLCGSELLLMHVADGWAARNYEQLGLAESEEMIVDRNYLEATAGQSPQRNPQDRRTRTVRPDRDDDARASAAR